MASIDELGDVAVFVRVAEVHGFGKAAPGLGISASQVSRTVARLEETLGTRLFHRTTRSLALTEAGRELFERAAAALRDLDEATRGTRDHGGELRGTLRVTAPVQFGNRWVSPHIASFSLAHPGVRFELVFDDRIVDLVAEGFDVAVRAGNLKDSGLIGRKVGETRQLTVASPAYLARKGIPADPTALAGHEALVFGRDRVPAPLVFRGPAGERRIRVEPRLVGNSVEALYEAAVAGLGITRLPSALAAPAVHQGLLVRILAEWEEVMPIWVVHAPGRNLSPKVRAFAQHLVDGLSPQPWSLCPST